jgi:NhaP-type Na+/H+ or K+/H+ antiporter
MALETGLQAAAAVATAGVLANLVGRRLPVPVPIFLLLSGMLLGSEGLGVVKTAEITDLVRVGVALAVAIIVFEGGTLLSWPMLRRVGPVVRNLVVGGLIVTPLVGAIAAHALLGYEWRAAVLFGTLVSVTGPSVITPLLRKVRVNDRLRTVLMSEGVIIDPFGALLTLIALQVAVSEALDPAAPAAWAALRVATGAGLGATGALAVYLVPRIVRRMSSREVSLLVVAAAITVFAAAESVAHESGLTAMVVMGIAVGNLPLPHREAIHAFQETVVVFLIAAVYVLLAASVDVEAVVELWPRGFVVVAILAAVGRPLLALLASAGSELSWRERAFLAAVAPRGVVAASLASVVALEAAAILGADASSFVALVFLVILLTIGVQSAYAGPLARLLGVMPRRTVIAGAGEVGLRAAERLRSRGEPVLLIESDEAAAVRAREEGFEVLIGDIADPRTLKRANVGDAQAFIIATAQDDRGLLAAQHAKALGCRNIIARVNDPLNVEPSRALGIAAVSQQEAVAAELASLASESELVDVLAAADEDLTVRRVWVTNPAMQRSIAGIGELQGTVVMLVRRGSQTVIPTGKTVLQLGDRLTLIGARSAVERAERALSGGGAEE